MASSIDLHPPIHWGQTPNHVSLRIGLTDVKFPRVDIDPSSIKFQATGCSGSRGEQLYSFEIELYEKIDAEASTYRINDREINLHLVKAKAEATGGWPRLTKSSAKLPWLKADFDKMTFSDDESDREQKKPMLNQNFSDDFYKPPRPKNRSAKPQGFLDPRTIWLLFYNLFQFMAYFWVFTRLTIYFVSHGHLNNSFRHVQNAIKLCQAVSMLEIIHPIIGFTKGDWTAPLIQFLGRNFILFILVNYNPPLQTSPVVCYLLLVWSFVELFRYPYYGVRVLNIENRLMTWFRYTLWIVLYPLGAFLEGLLVYKSLHYYQSTGHFSMSLPNRINFSFDFPLLLKCHLFVLPLGLLHMMRYMSIQRKKTLMKKKN